MISILLATYNGEKFIQHSIESILNQTYQNWKLLIGFNGTTDSSKSIVSTINDPRVHTYDFLNDKGKAKTLNKLLDKVDTPWCAIQDDDDIWHEKKLERQVEYIDNYDVIGTQIKYIDENTRIIGGPSLACENDMIKFLSLKGTNQVANSSAIFRTEIAKKIWWKEDLDGIEDFDFWLKIMRNKESKFKNINEYLCFHRIHSESNFNTKKYDIAKIL
jgi:teichuronic acid biosynthesis glycosyltransferase TuaG